MVLTQSSLLKSGRVSSAHAHSAISQAVVPLCGPGILVMDQRAQKNIRYTPIQKQGVMPPPCRLQILLATIRSPAPTISVSGTLAETLPQSPAIVVTPSPGENQTGDFISLIREAKGTTDKNLPTSGFIPPQFMALAAVLTNFAILFISFLITISAHSPSSLQGLPISQPICRRTCGGKIECGRG